MTHVVITGASKGIGKALALEFLRKGATLTISGRNQERLDNTVSVLKEESGSNSCQGIVCDVRNQEALENLWKDSARILPINIWINNAGVNHSSNKLINLDIKEIDSVIDTNIRGCILGSRAALSGMMKQGFGALYNMEGLGSDGRIVEGTSIYGTSKSAVRYFTRSLIKEQRSSPVIVGSISPGIVITDMILEPIRKEPELNKEALKIFHILADPPGRVCPWIVHKLLSNRKHGKHFAWLNTRKIMLRFFLNMFKNRKVEGLPVF